MVLLYILHVLYLHFYFHLQERHAILDGQTELAITVDIGGNPTNLSLTSAGLSILFTSGTCWEFEVKIIVINLSGMLDTS